MNQGACDSQGGNISFNEICGVRMGKIRYLGFTQAGVLTESDLQSSTALRAKLRELMLKERGDVEKFYLFPVINEGDDNTEEPERGTLADGYSEVLSEKSPAYTLRSVASLCQQQAMVTFNGWSGKVFVIDDKNQFTYIETDTDGGQGFTVGDLYVSVPRWGTGGAIPTASISLTFKNIDEFKSGIGTIKIDFDITKIVNTNDVKLVEKAAAAGYVVTIGGLTKCTGTDIYTAYKTLLATPNAWRANLVSSGAAVDIDNVVADDANAGWDITLDDDPVIAGGAKIIINLKAPADLAALGTPVTGIEGIEIIVTKAA